MSKILLFKTQHNPPKKTGLVRIKKTRNEKYTKNSEILPVVLISGLYKIRVLCSKLADVHATEVN